MSFPTFLYHFYRSWTIRREGVGKRSFDVGMCACIEKFKNIRLKFLCVLASPSINFNWAEIRRKWLLGKQVKRMMKIRKLMLAFVDNGLLTLKALSLLFSFSCSLKSSWWALTEFSISSVERIYFCMKSLSQQSTVAHANLGRRMITISSFVRLYYQALFSRIDVMFDSGQCQKHIYFVYDFSSCKFHLVFFSCSFSISFSLKW